MTAKAEKNGLDSELVTWNKAGFFADFVLFYAIKGVWSCLPIQEGQSNRLSTGLQPQLKHSP